jgi:hypothetical protein
MLAFHVTGNRRRRLSDLDERTAGPKARTTAIVHGLSRHALLVDAPFRRVYIPSAVRSQSSFVGWCAAALVATIVATVSGQTPTGKPQLPKGQMPDLGRPTKVGDELPLFSFSATGGPFRNYSNPWWRKDTTATK